MRNYEIMFIVRPTLGEDEVKKVVKDFSDIITKNGGKVTKEENMGQRELAYEIKDFKSGYYFVFEVEAKDNKAIKEFDRLALINNDIVRHLITKVEE
ncbi:30S ribosomal protein S6 [Firmicutes bacterium CAG:822]|nr:30S ribosomal protein S6 [Firmicutes bacterium CAG:822]